ncbi:MAG: hypothetical protein U9O20_02800 [Patescibacteria group bacterium]|nr:hypothetical protein [Patescibacteria group bacterium]
MLFVTITIFFLTFFQTSSIDNASDKTAQQTDKIKYVQPERFQGLHTETDFEIFPEKLESEIEIQSICKGEVIEKRNVGECGGVVI